MVYYEAPKEVLAMIQRIIIHKLNLLLSKEEWEESKKLGSLLEKLTSQEDWIAKEYIASVDSILGTQFLSDIIFHPNCKKHVLEEDDFVCYVKEIKEIDGNRKKWMWVKEEK